MATQAITTINQFKTTQFRKLCIVLVAGLALAACGKKDNADQGKPMQALPVSVIAVKPTSVPITTETVAQTEGAKEVEIRPRVGGILLKKLFEEGAPIKTGQTMFLIDPVPFQIALTNAQARLAQQKARIEQTNREAARLKALLVTQSISQRDYDNAVSDNEIAKANLLAAEADVRDAQLNLSYTSVKAPSSGIAGRFLFSEGALVDANTSLLTTIVQISPIWVRFGLSESDLTNLGGSVSEKTVKNVTLTLPDGTQYGQSGKLNFAASQIDPVLGTQQLRAEFANTDKSLLPGQFVRAVITTGERDGVFLVPQTAVQTGDQGKFLYVVEKDKTGQTIVNARPIEVGSWQGDNWVILKGLNDGDRVAVDNLLKLRPGEPVAPHPAGEAPAAPSSK